MLAINGITKDNDVPRRKKKRPAPKDINDVTRIEYP